MAATATRKRRVPATTRTDIFVAKEDGFVHVDGADLQIVKGRTLVHRGHPIYKRAPDYFEPVRVHYSVLVETTAAPGEPRD